jgi:hypothetical protein
MRALALSSLLALSIAGCITFEEASDDDDSTPSPTPTATPTGTLAVTWQPVTAAGDGSAVNTTCPVAATRVAVHAAPAAGAPLVQSFPCAGLAGSLVLAAGSYEVWVRFTNDSLTERYAESPHVDVVVTANGSVPADFDVFVDHAFHRVGWTIRSGGTPMACAAVAGENGVTITATDGGGALLETTVDCEEGDGMLTTTRPIPLGTDYTVMLALLDGNDAVLGSSSAILPAFTGLDYGNEYRDLGIVDIHLD